jgi:DNA-binding response OmpR family regulator
MYGKVLCVDEDQRITRSLQLQLREHGIDCVRETNGVDGFNAAVRYSPEAIITEFALSEGLGSYMLGRLRDCEIEIPVIFLTNIGEEMYPGLQQHLMDLGACAVLRKPFKIESILVELRKHINLPAEMFPDQQSDVNLPEKPGGHEIAPHIPIGGRKSARERTHRPATSDERRASRPSRWHRSQLIKP